MTQTFVPGGSTEFKRTPLKGAVLTLIYMPPGRDANRCVIEARPYEPAKFFAADGTLLAGFLNDLKAGRYDRLGR
ncbi:hypothetical protein SAMN05216359_101499 [Roseateles sp. YR242]|nr:hypothetical protein SAMN05216359_101499 [Roseateles sp. YR242]